MGSARLSGELAEGIGPEDLLGRGGDVDAVVADLTVPRRPRNVQGVDRAVRGLELDDHLRKIVAQSGIRLGGVIIPHLLGELIGVTPIRDHRRPALSVEHLAGDPAREQDDMLVAGDTTQGHGQVAEGDDHVPDAVRVAQMGDGDALPVVHHLELARVEVGHRFAAFPGHGGLNELERNRDGILKRRFVDGSVLSARQPAGRNSGRQQTDRESGKNRGQTGQAGRSHVSLLVERRAGDFRALRRDGREPSGERGGVRHPSPG